MILPEFKKGNILMAQPFMDSLHFKDSVILITDHSDENGTVGFIINKSLNIFIPDVVDGFPDIELELHYGGPVQTDTLYYVHKYGDILKDSLAITDRLFWGGDFTQLKVLIREKIIDPSGIRFYLGYSGWSAGQLADEYEAGTWMLSEIDSNYLFKKKLGDIWPQAVYNLGDKFEVISKIPGSINWN